jgi:hypothetical protein
MASRARPPVSGGILSVEDAECRQADVGDLFFIQLLADGYRTSPVEAAD